MKLDFNCLIMDMKTDTCNICKPIQTTTTPNITYAQKHLTFYVFNHRKIRSIKQKRTLNANYSIESLRNGKNIYCLCCRPKPPACACCVCLSACEFHVCEKYNSCICSFLQSCSPFFLPSTLK